MLSHAITCYHKLSSYHKLSQVITNRRVLVRIEAQTQTSSAKEGKICSTSALFADVLRILNVRSAMEKQKLYALSQIHGLECDRISKAPKTIYKTEEWCACINRPGSITDTASINPPLPSRSRPRKHQKSCQWPSAHRAHSYPSSWDLKHCVIFVYKPLQ